MFNSSQYPASFAYHHPNTTFDPNPQFSYFPPTRQSSGPYPDPASKSPSIYPSSSSPPPPRPICSPPTGSSATSSPTTSDTQIEAIAVGTEVFIDTHNTTKYLVAAMKNIHAALFKFNLDYDINVSCPIALSAILCCNLVLGVPSSSLRGGVKAKAEAETSDVSSNGPQETDNEATKNSLNNILVQTKKAAHQ